MLTIPLPPLPLQKGFVLGVKAIEWQKNLAEQAAEKNEALFQSLLQRAFKGELVIYFTYK